MVISKHQVLKMRTGNHGISETILWNGKRSARGSVSRRWLFSCKTLCINFVWSDRVLCLSHWIMNYDQHQHHHGRYNDQYQLLHFIENQECIYQGMHTVVQLQGGGQDRRPEALLMTQDSLKQDVPTLMAKAPAMQELGTGVEAQYLVELNRHVATLSKLFARRLKLKILDRNKSQHTVRDSNES